MQPNSFLRTCYPSQWHIFVEVKYVGLFLESCSTYESWSHVASSRKIWWSREELHESTQTTAWRSTNCGEFEKTKIFTVQTKSLSYKYTNYRIYYTLKSQSLFWLAESVQYIFKINACDFIYNLGQNGWKIKTTPPPVSMMEKMARFHCSVSTSLSWGEACFFFSFYSVQDCSCRLYNNHVKDIQCRGKSCHVWLQCMISKGNHVNFVCFVLLAISEEVKTWLPLSFFALNV